MQKKNSPPWKEEAMSEEISREQIALTMFCATLERTIDKADRMAFKEGVVKVAKEQIAAAYLLADIWIAERQTNRNNENG